MSRYKTYPEYKNSGVKWLGKVPSHWSVSKVKYLTSFQVGWTPPTKDDGNFEGENLWANISDLKEREIFDTNKKISDSAAKIASMEISPKGSLLYSFKLSVGTVSFAGKDMYTNEAIASFLEESKLPLSYLYYVLPKYLIENASTNIYGARILNQELICNADLIAPTFDEAQNVANFLDHETAKIDVLIEKQQRLIELLKEKRQAVISYAVTKGLNPNAPMKDSGVEWLGEVPAHWVVARYKFCTSRILVGIAEAATHAYDESGTPIIRSTNIREEGLNQDGMLFIKKYFAEQVKSKYLYKDDIVTVRTGHPGISSVVPASLDKSHCFTNLIATPLAKHTPQFLAEYLNSHIGKKYFELNAWGSAQKNISVPILQDFSIAYPERSEEENIEKYITSQKEKFTNLIARAENSISLMQERRTALISAAVTGKIDVRDWQAAAEPPTALNLKTHPDPSHERPS